MPETAVPGDGVAARMEYPERRRFRYWYDGDKLLLCTALSVLYAFPCLSNRHVPARRSNPGPIVRATLMCAP